MPRGATCHGELPGLGFRTDWFLKQAIVSRFKVFHFFGLFAKDFFINTLHLCISTKFFDWKFSCVRTTPHSVFREIFLLSLPPIFPNFPLGWARRRFTLKHSVVYGSWGHPERILNSNEKILIPILLSIQNIADAIIPHLRERKILFSVMATLQLQSLDLDQSLISNPVRVMHLLKLLSY